MAARQASLMRLIEAATGKRIISEADTDSAEEFAEPESEDADE